MIMHDKYIIIGCCARSGSAYMNHVLRKTGLLVGHERPDVDGVVGWQQLISTDTIRCKAEEMAAGREIILLMQVRHPVKVINSMALLYREEWPTLAGENPIDYRFRIEAVEGQSGLAKAISLYYYLNNASEKTDWQKLYKVEEIGREWASIANLIGITGTLLPEVPTSTNTRKGKWDYPDYGWEDIYAENPLFAEHIERMAAKWGYEKYGY